MENTTLALAIIMTAGFFTAKLGQFLKLPSVTGYILAGLLLGPSGFSLVSSHESSENLSHFTQIALMLIAFGIGEHLELKKLRRSFKRIGLIALTEICCAFFLVSSACLLAAKLTGVGGGTWVFQDYIALAVLLGAISVATAPAATLHVMREVKASGPLTSTVMTVIAVDNGLAITLFGISLSAVSNLIGIGNQSFPSAFFASIVEISSSLLLGVIIGLVIDFILQHLRNRGEMLTVGLALLLLCGEIARLMEYSALLAGMAAGFTIINRDRRDVRLFRALNTFEPPIHVLFFTLAGAHLDISALTAGWLGLVYFLFRVVGKYSGSYLGAKMTNAPLVVCQNLGLTLVPQAGVAIGLIFLVDGNPQLHRFSVIITPVVLMGIALSEVFGPLSARHAVERAGESGLLLELNKTEDKQKHINGVEIAPWEWDKLNPANSPAGNVIFGASNIATVAGLARLSTIFAHLYEAMPMAVRVNTQQNHQTAKSQSPAEIELFQAARSEVEKMGYELITKTINGTEIADTIISAANHYSAKAIVLGYPLEGTALEFERVVDKVADKSPCPVIVVRFTGLLYTEQILVPVIDFNELDSIREIIRALCKSGDHHITLFGVMSQETGKQGLIEARERLENWIFELVSDGLATFNCETIAVEERQEAIIAEASNHDLLVMAASRSQGLERLFFGSLAEGVARNCQKPMLMIHGTELPET
jgi:Kef-type K+ transport system membrane component KefB/nucleotide-binding universal stress UspA family protein